MTTREAFVSDLCLCPNCVSRAGDKRQSAYRNAVRPASRGSKRRNPPHQGMPTRSSRARSRESCVPGKAALVDPTETFRPAASAEPRRGELALQGAR